MSIYNENGVPILADVGGRFGLSPKSLNAVNEQHDRAYAAQAEAKPGKGDDVMQEHLYMGDSVLVHNKAPVHAIVTTQSGETVVSVDAPPYSGFSVGGSTLQEALTEVIGAFDQRHVGSSGEPSDHLYPPDWVASTNEDIARYLAEYYHCEVRDLTEVI